LTTSALTCTAFTSVDELCPLVAPYLTVPRPSRAELPRTELRLRPRPRATLLDLQQRRCAACGDALPERNPRTGQSTTASRNALTAPEMP
jgi:hypothetical protein